MASNSPRFGEVSDLKTFRKHYPQDMDESLFIPVSVNFGEKSLSPNTDIRSSSFYNTKDETLKAKAP